MPGVFRRKWFPRPRFHGGLVALNATSNLIGVSATAAVGSASLAYQTTLASNAVTSHVGTFSASFTFNLSGVAATAAVGSITHFDTERTLAGQAATAAEGQFTFNITSSPNLGGVSASAVVGSFFTSGNFDLFGLHVTTAVPDPAFFVSKTVNLRGVQVVAAVLVSTGAGGGGGGAAGLYGSGQRGFNGSATGSGGHGGDADNNIVPGAVVAGAAGVSGSELALGYGSGSGGAGAAFNSGAGATVYNYNGTIFISYISSITTGLKFVTLTSANNASSPFMIPADWTNQNVLSLTGSGCTDHGDDVLFNNVTNFNPGDLVAFHCSLFCSELPTTFGTYSADSGVNAPALSGKTGGDGGLYGGGGGGGTGGGGGRGGDGLIFLQYKSTSDNTTIFTIILKVADNAGTPFRIPTDWSDSNFVYLSGSGGCGGFGSTSQGANGGEGSGITAGFDTSAFSPGEVVPYFVSPGCSGLPTIFGPFAARSGRNGDDNIATFGLLDHLQIVLPCDGSTGDGTVGPTRPGGSILVE